MISKILTWWWQSGGWKPLKHEKIWDLHGIEKSDWWLMKMEIEMVSLDSFSKPFLVVELIDRKRRDFDCGFWVREEMEKWGFELGKLWSKEMKKRCIRRREAKNREVEEDDEERRREEKRREEERAEFVVCCLLFLCRQRKLDH